MKATVGRIVNYTMNTDDINAVHHPERVGSANWAGRVLPMIVTAVRDNEYGIDHEGVSGQVFLDGDDMFYVKTAGEGKDHGQWSWPERE